MQRTARAIFECLPRSERKPSPCAIATLNLVYTVIVFVWLLDRTNGNKLTKWFTAKSLRIVGLAYFPAQNDRRWRGRQFAKNDNTAGGDRR